MFAASKTASVSGGYQISRSLRFNSADSAYLNRTPASATNQKTWTWSGWVKRSAFGTDQQLFSAGGSGAFQFLYQTSTDCLYIYDSVSSTTAVITTQVFRDPSAWYHVVLATDTTQATASNRFKLYINGVQVTSFGTATYPAQNSTLSVNNTVNHSIGSWSGAGGGNFFSGYMTEINFIDGQALTPSSFGQTDAQTGVWQPKAYSGSYGTNGFYLNFSDNSNTTAATLGKDYSGNGNNWTPNNFSVSAGAGNDSLVDSPTSYGSGNAGGDVRGNYATMNPLALGASGSLANGNLDVSYVAGGRSATGSTIGLTSGKWYWEATITATNLTNTTAMLGLTTDSAVNISTSYPGSNASSWGYYGNDGTKYNSASASAYGAVYGLNDVIGVAFDADAGTLTFYKNGTSQGTAFTGLTSGPYYPTVGNGASSYTFTSAFNFGQRPFAYTAPSGYKALCTQNLPTPTIGSSTATQAGKYFGVTLRNGGAPSGGTYTTTVDMSNGALLWDKPRNQASDHYLVDTNRGLTKFLQTDLTNAESTQANWYTSFGNGTYSTGSTDWGSGVSIVDWIWAAGANTTNTAGSITSTVSANTTSGFSVVTFTGANAGATVGHGLGAVPQMIIMKTRNAADNWYVYHVSVGATQYLILNGTNAAATAGSVWNNTTPTSTVFSVGNNTGLNTEVAYCFAEVAGYSKFGSYTGNGSSDGPFVYTGFRPAFIMRKRTDSSATGQENWIMQDVRRSTYNEAGNALGANRSYDEATFGTTSYGVDVLSNGFKVRDTTTYTNASGGTYIYMAIAENPFKYALAR